MSAPAPQRHLLGVWNPSYEARAMEATLQMLLAAAREHRAGVIPEDEVYVWWGKIRSPHRHSPLPHLPEILATENELSSEEGLQREVHLYLTDYQSLFVGHVAEITTDDVREDDAERVPAFYAERGVSCDCWFRLFDIRRVFAEGTASVAEELRKLRNTRYHDNPVSIYGGMVDLPLIVTRDDGARFFEADVRERLTEGRFWVEFDAERMGTGGMERDLRENMFGEEAWRGLEPAARSFVATAEVVFRAHRADPAFDFGPVIVDFAKAFEVQANAVLRRALRNVPPAKRRANMDGRTVDVASGELWTLGQLARIIGEEPAINAALKLRLVHGEWFAASLPPILRELADYRNPGAHTDALGREQVTDLRNRLVGVGCTGALVELGRVRATGV
ncbi:MAG TPA: hypothetical protein VFS05_11705 [Gemmatimonadaceae bacterium]|nr:hypothetical protein [Gemmatimonadaceae bacterium]